MPLYSSVTNVSSFTRRNGTGEGAGGGGGALTAPAAFAVGDWTVADEQSGSTLTVTITGLPSDGGSAITRIDYRVDGGSWTDSGRTTVGAFDITGLTDTVEYDIELRAANAIGDGAASDVKAATPTTATTLTIFAVGDSITVNGRYVDTLDTIITARQSLAVTSSKHAENGHSFNYAWSGSGNPNTLEDIAVADVDPSATSAAILLVYAGTNGLVLAGATPEDEADDADTFLQNRIAAGFTASNIYVLDMLPRNGYTEWKRLRYCALLEAVCTSLGVNYVSIASIPELQTYNSTILPDGIHPSDAVHDLIAEMIYDHIYPAHDWNPTTISSSSGVALALWLDSMDAATMFTDAGKTAPAGSTDQAHVWADKSGNGRDMVQATSIRQPIRTTLDGYAALDFGSFRYGDIASMGGINSDAITFGMFSDVPTGNVGFFAAANAAANSVAFRAASRAIQGVGVSGLSVPSHGQPVERPVSFVVSYPSGHALQNGGRTLSGTATPTSTTLNSARIGYDWGGYYVNGKMGDIILFAGKLDGVYCSRLDRYLRVRRGLTDINPDLITFTDSLAQPTSTVITSNILTVAGLSTDTQVALINMGGSPVNGVQVKLNGAAATSSALMVENGDTIQLQWTTPASASTENGAIFRLGNRFLIWRVTT